MTGLGAMRMPLPYVRSWPKADRPVTGKFEESRPLAVHQSIAHSAETLFDKGHFWRKVIGICWLTPRPSVPDAQLPGARRTVVKRIARQIYIPIVNWTLVVLVVFYRIVLRYGFMDEGDVPRDLAAVKVCGGAFSMMTTSYFLDRQKLIPSTRPGMALWRNHLFGWMNKNS